MKTQIQIAFTQEYIAAAAQAMVGANLTAVKSTLDVDGN